MSAADDILFAPIAESDWRVLCREIVDYLDNHPSPPRFNMVRAKASIQAPAGALLLEQLCELYHEHKQDIFFVVYVPSKGSLPIELLEIYFNGSLTFTRYEEGGFPHLTTVTRWSIRDLNLVRNAYTDHYVFAATTEALAYIQDIGS